MIFDAMNTKVSLNGRDAVTLEEEDVLSISSIDTQLLDEQPSLKRKWCDNLQNYLQSQEMTKSSFDQISNERFRFRHGDNLDICLSIRRNGQENLDISCVVFDIPKFIKSKGYRPSSYCFMTKIMKYKAIFQGSENRQQQIVSWREKLFYIRSISSVWLRTEHFSKLLSELEDFCLMGEQITKDFEENLKRKVLQGRKQWENKKRDGMPRSSSYFL